MSDTAIIDIIRKAAGIHNMQFSTMVVCSVQNVDLSTRTCVCSPLNGTNTSDLTSVQLMAEVDDGFLLIPAIDSTVIVCYSTRNVPYIALFSRIQKVILVSIDGIQLQDGSLGGLVIPEALTEHLNIIESTVNAIIAKLNTLSPTPIIPVIIETTKEEIENTAITQGGL